MDVLNELDREPYRRAMTEYTGPKAITTVYNGFRFRSRLEARWAVFLDQLGIKYEYEPEGFVLGDGSTYLPDFRLTEFGCWLEIKPRVAEPDSDAWNKAKRLAEAAGANVYIVSGAPNIKGGESLQKFGPDMEYLDGEPEDAGWDQCPLCRRFQPVTGNGPMDYECRCVKDLWSDVTYDRVEAARLFAQQARFEFGETPKGPSV